MAVHWALHLSSYDDDAPKTLLAQHDLLQALVDGNDPNLSLTLRVVAEGKGDVFVSCHLLCEGGRRSTRLARTLLDVASTGLLPGYSLGHGRDPREHYSASVAELCPVHAVDQGPPIKPDWAQIIDLLRRRGGPMVIDLRCSATRGTDRRSIAPARVLGTDFGTAVLEALAVPGLAERAVNLSVVVSEPRRLDSTFVSVVGRKLFGDTCQVMPITGPEEAVGTLLTPSEALRVWHAPYGSLQGRGLGRPTSNVPLVAARIPTRGVSLGTARQEGPRIDQRTDVFLTPADRTRHVYVIGKTGSGKTNLLKRIARQDLEQGKGCVVISPHADLINFLVDSAADRLEDVVLLDFGDPRYVPQVNPLAVDVHTPAEFARAAEQLTELVAGLSFHEWSGPVFHDAVRTALHTAALPKVRGDRDPTVAVAVEIVRDPKLRDWAAKIADASRRDIGLELSRVADLRASERSEYERWVTAKFGSFAVDGPLRAVTSSRGQSPFSFRDIYRNQKILLVHLPDTYLGGNAAEFIGRFVFERLYHEARLATPNGRKDFNVHVDEFQRFVNRDLEVLVTEARKFRLGLTFAHQNLRQLHAFSRFEGTASPRLAEAIFSNVGTLVAMRTSGSDVTTLAHELEVSEQHVRRIAQYEALVRPCLDGTEQRAFSLRVPLEERAADRSARAAVRKRMIDEGYWASRAAVERSLDQHLAQLRSAATPTPPSKRGPAKNARAGKSGSAFLDEWMAKRAQVTPTAGTASDTTTESEGRSS